MSHSHHHVSQHWIELHASEILVEPDPEKQMLLLRFLASDDVTFNRLRDALIKRSRATFERFEHSTYRPVPDTYQLHL